MITQELCKLASTGNSPHTSPLLLALALLCFQLSESCDEELQVVYRGVAVS